jgi:hypothetical protein
VSGINKVSGAKRLQVTRLRRFQVSGIERQRVSDRTGSFMIRKNYLDVEDLEVYKRLCQLHIDVCDLTYSRPKEEKFELGTQVRRSSNSSPAQLAEKNDDRHIRNKIEGVNRIKT